MTVQIYLDAAWKVLCKRALLLLIKLNEVHMQVTKYYCDRCEIEISQYALTEMCKMCNHGERYLRARCDRIIDAWLKDKTLDFTSIISSDIA